AVVRHVGWLVPKGPEGFPRVVVRNGAEKGPRRRKPVVEIRPVEEERVDAEVDGVAGRADGAELRQLLPVVAPTKRLPRAGAERRRCDGCGLLLHEGPA